MTGEKKAVIHRRGTFVFRLAGRERQQSASYYTPEVLTRFTVSQALAELLDQDGHKTTAEEILGLTVCEPALGSGAFAIEAVRQLAEQYLRRRQAELGKRIDPDKYPTELQRVKASIALHQVYGVDLNVTAVELAEISLWLDTMVSGLQAPWFGLRLRRGNSLIGARRAVYTRAQVNDKSWLKATPTDVPMTGMVEEMANETTARQTDGRIHHFLLPASGWGSAVEVKEAKEAVALAPEAVAALKKWRSAITGKPSQKQLNALVELAHRVESLWQLALRRLEIAEAEGRRDIPLWGRDDPGHTQVVTREQIEQTLAKPNGAYLRLRRVMDAWAALWFWPLTGTGGVAPPTLDQWTEACQQLLGREPEARRSSKGMTTLGAATNWEDLNDAEDLDLDFAGAMDVGYVLDRHPWLKVCEKTAVQQGFFHWEVDFATVFARGGFDLQLGNPPWVQPRTDLDALLAEGDPWWELSLKPSEEARKAMREATLALPGIRDLVIEGTSDVVVTMEYLGSVQAYSLLAGLQSDLYRCFMQQTWRHSSRGGIITLIHPESHFTDEKAAALREDTYLRLRRHWQFINELLLYDVGDRVRYGIHVYGRKRDRTQFLMASSLYHPDTVERSLKHDGSGGEPGLKDPNGNWDIRPHRNRIINVTDETLGIWHAVLEDDSVPVRQTGMVYTVNSSAADVLGALPGQTRVASLDLQFSRGWDESRDRKNGYFELRWGVPQSWDDVILQGPHLNVATPMFKSPNKEMAGKHDWSATDFEKLVADAIPVTAYKPSGSRARYDADYTQWESGPARDHYRVAWRAMAANMNERTLFSALIPPGAAHPHGVFSAARPGESLRSLSVLSGFLSSLIADFAVRAAPKSGISLPTINRLPVVIGHPLQASLVARTLRLNCITNAYADLWADVYHPAFTDDRWVSGRPRANRPDLGDVAPKWTATTPLRIAEDRRQALAEVDALVALMLGVTADQLCTIYRTQFPVLYGYDHNSYVYDAKGRLVPNEVLSVWRKKGDKITGAERTATNRAGYTYIYELPFTLLDREADMRTAYAEFERRLASTMSELLPSAQAREIRDGLLDYLTTTFALADPDAQLALEDFLGDREHGIFKGPFLRLRLPFRAAADGWQSILGWDIGLTPYGHQAEAFARLSTADLGPDKPRPLPTLVTTGTGSGKTEAFLYPILDHVLRARRDGVTGMKALILYPMNALANDQAQRLADLLTTRDELAGITAALYTGQDGSQRTKVSADGLITDRAIIRDDRTGHPAHELQDAGPAPAPPRGQCDLAAERAQPPVPRARRVPHLRRRAGHRRRDAAAPPRPHAEELPARRHAHRRRTHPPARPDHPCRHLRDPRGSGRPGGDDRLREHCLRRRLRRDQRRHRIPPRPRRVDGRCR